MEQKKQLNTTLTLIMDGDNVLLGQKNVALQREHLMALAENKTQVKP